MNKNLPDLRELFNPLEPLLVVVDTSGSYGGEAEKIQAFLEQLLTLKAEASRQDDVELLVVPADTSLRSAPYTLTRDNLSQFMERGRIGMGGTEFSQPLAEAAQLAVFQAQNIKTILYFSDLLAAPPKSREDCGLKEDIQVIFVFGGDDFDEHKWAAHFTQEVKPWASVAQLDTEPKLVPTAAKGASARRSGP